MREMIDNVIFYQYLFLVKQRSGAFTTSITPHLIVKEMGEFIDVCCGGLVMANVIGSLFKQN